MKDLVEISDHDFNSVNTVSIGIIFVIMIFVLKSISLPVILICIIFFTSLFYKNYNISTLKKKVKTIQFLLSN